jgi:hypothetical protein
MHENDPKVLRRSDSLGSNFFRTSPFGVLKASTRDDRSKIVTLADEQSLFLDQNLCAKARQDLTNPRNRMFAEVAWLPGLSPRKAERYVEQLDSQLDEYIENLKTEQPIVKANLIAAVIDVLSEVERNNIWVSLIIDLSNSVDEIDPIGLLRQINEDRQVSGFSEIQSVDALEEPLDSQKKYYKETIKTALDRMESSKILDVVGLIAKEATENGTRLAPILIDELIDSYRLEVTGFLEAEALNINKVVEAIKECPNTDPTKFKTYFEQLEKLVINWSAVALPIQLSMKSRGMEHDLSRSTGFSIRGAGFKLFSEHDLLQETKEITKLLKKYFEYFPELAETAEDDSQALANIERTRSFELMLKPFKDRLLLDLEAIDATPFKAEQVARKLLQDLPQLRTQAKQAGVPNDLIVSEEDNAAHVLLSCVVALGNHNEDWSACADIIERAKDFATSFETLERIDKNFKIVSKNVKLFKGMTPIKSAPTLQTINACGFTMYGSTDVDHETGSYMTTYYFVLIGIPIFPICRYRVIASGGSSYRFLAKGPLRDFDKWHLGLSIAVILYLFFAK